MTNKERVQLKHTVILEVLKKLTHQFNQWELVEDELCLDDIVDANNYLEALIKIEEHIEIA